MPKNDTTGTVKQNRAFISTIMAAPMLSREREFMLATRWRDEEDEEALHELVTAYVRLVVSMASKFTHYGLPLSDLVQEGNIGLMQAASRFEPEREIRFSTYASWWIKSAMQDYILRNWSIVRSGTSATQKSLFFNLRWLRAKIQNPEEGKVSTEALQSIAEKLRVGLKDVENMSNRLATRDQSLNAPISENGDDSVGDFLPDTMPNPEEVTMRVHDGQIRGKWLRTAMTELTDREQLIIRERRLTEDKVTLEALGVRLGITKERVRQIEHKAYEKLKSSVMRISQEEEIRIKH
ncbi:RNA polymerase factor sigma-32 [Sneathiella sp. P13V-1]|uniref:RNA polymerase factor sigma-32 n=1 Tax=Sneathiella sp. P13V-1 TaxID=2697366 RepID=UPI00187B755A|nr:RNA polymerase factor sigma-32 [Sneathiella sp. P13V-1]MBE7636722.1 RNA polymerase factor sigma-32 [Sneathiella sp. P13V-1]